MAVLTGTYYFNTPTPSTSAQLQFILTLALSLSHTYLDSRKIIVWGENTCGQLGVGDTNPRHIPTVVTSLEDKRIKGVECGQKHMIAWTGSEVFSCGANNYYQLGHGMTTEAQYLLPMPIKSMNGRVVHSIATSGFSAASISTVTISVTYNNQTQRRTVPSSSTTLAEVMQPLLEHWNIDPQDIVVEDNLQRLVHPNARVRKLFVRDHVTAFNIISRHDAMGAIAMLPNATFSFSAGSGFPQLKAAPLESLVQWIINTRFPGMLLAPLTPLSLSLSSFNPTHTSLSLSSG